MFSSCCCCGENQTIASEDASKSTNTTQIAGLPCRGDGDLGDVNEMEQLELRTPREAAAVMSVQQPRRTPQTNGLKGQSTSSSISNEERRKREKEKLQHLVKEFASAAVEGFAVNMWDVKQRAVRLRMFHMERYLRWFSLKLLSSSREDDELLNVAEEYHMENISTVSKSLSDLSMHFPGVSESSIVDYAVLVVEGSSNALLFVFDDFLSRDKFYTCLKVLRMSASINKQRMSEDKT